PLPEPYAQQLGRRVLEPWDLVQYAMVELADEQRLDAARDLVEVDQPAGRWIDRSRQVDVDLERVTMHPVTLVLGRHHRQPVRGLEAKRTAQLDVHGHSRT